MTGEKIKEIVELIERRTRNERAVSREELLSKYYAPYTKLCEVIEGKKSELVQSISPMLEDFTKIVISLDFLNGESVENMLVSLKEDLASLTVKYDEDPLIVQLSLCLYEYMAKALGADQVRRGKVDV